MKVSPADKQSAGLIIKALLFRALPLLCKASKGTRTLDPFITSEVLYQLSYRSLLVSRKNVVIIVRISANVNRIFEFYLFFSV